MQLYNQREGEPQQVNLSGSDTKERRRGRSSRISPEFNVDDMIFNKLILGYDYLDDVDFSDIIVL